MGRIEKRVCVNCGESFTADARKKRHQCYCTDPACKAASKRNSQAKWLAKPENQDYHRGPEAVARVTAWRAAHPGYSRRPCSLSVPVQDDWITPTYCTNTPLSTPESKSLPLPEQRSCNASGGALQDLLTTQPVVLVGLIAHIWGSALQEDIASTLSRLLQLGLDIRGGRHEYDQTGLNPERLRQVPEHFSWLDHRLVREHTIEKADVCAWALYLFLVTVADAHGLSYYSEASLSQRLKLDPKRLAQARRDLIALDLIAYDPPLTQVLSVPESLPVATRIERLHAILEGRA